MSPRPEILVRGDDLKGLARTVGVSALAHVAAIGLLLLAPQRFLRAAPPVASYTLDLVASDQLAGTNLPALGKPGAKKAPPARTMVAKTTVAEKSVPKREAPQISAVKKAPAQTLPVKPARVVEKKKAPAKPAAPEAKPEPKEKVVPKPKVEKVPKKPAAEKAAVEKLPVKPAKVLEKKKAPAKPAAREAKPEQKEKAAAKPKVEGEVPRSAGSSGEASAPVESRSVVSEAEKRDRTILAAIQRRAEHVRRTELGVPDGIPGGPDSAGVMSVGPGTSGGGAVRGVEYLLYYNRMLARIKEGWVWAGAGGALEAVVQFRITEDGVIVEVRTVRSSGDASYDLSVEQAVRRAGPLGPPPEQYRAEFAKGVEITFRAQDLRS